jgi:transposase
MKTTERQIKQIRKMYQKGKSLMEISEKLNLNYSRVQYYAKEYYRKSSIERAAKYQKKHPPKVTKHRREYMRNYMKEYHKRNKNES